MGLVTRGDRRLVAVVFGGASGQARNERAAELLEYGFLRYAWMDAFGDRLKRRYHETLGEDGQMYVERMQSAVGRMRSLIEDLLDIAQAIRGAKDYVLQLFKPGHCLDPALNAVEPYSRETLREFAARLAPLVGRCRVRGAAPSTGG